MISQLTQETPSTVAHKHIKGHQDKCKKRINLSWSAQLNIRANKLTHCPMQHDDANSLDMMFPVVKAYVANACRLIASNKDKLSNASTQEKDCITCLQMNRRWGNKALSDADGCTHKTAMKRNSLQLQEFIRKHLHGRLSTSQ